MKRRVKKCVSAFLALMLLTTLLPAAGFAADEQRATSNEQVCLLRHSHRYSLPNRCKPIPKAIAHFRWKRM